MDKNTSALSRGQIRQTGTERGTLKFLLYSIEEEDEQALIVPVSRYDLPKTDNEMVVTTTASEHIVLQAWNARHSDLDRTKESEVIGNITEEEQLKVREVLLYWLLGDAVSESTRANMGTSNIPEDQSSSYMSYVKEGIELFDSAGL